MLFYVPSTCSYFMQKRVQILALGLHGEAARNVSGYNVWKSTEVWDQVHCKLYRVAPAEEITHSMIDATIRGIKSNSMINKRQSRKRISLERMYARIKAHIEQST